MDSVLKPEYYDSLLANQYVHAHLALIDRWADFKDWNKLVILKTDMYAEAVNPNRSFLWSIKNEHTIGIDIEPQVVRLSNSRCTCVNCDVRKLPFKNSSFDLVISDSTLDHFRRKDDIMVALLEISRIVKKDGILIIIMDNGSNSTNWLYRIWIKLGLNHFYVGHTYTMRELVYALDRAGMNVESTSLLIHNPRFFTKRIVTLLRKIEPSKLDSAICKVLGIFDRFGNEHTAQFIAAKAIKCI
jgi:SAM-dependent methyltransferase